MIIREINTSSKDTNFKLYKSIVDSGKLFVIEPDQATNNSFNIKKVIDLNNIQKILKFKDLPLNWNGNDAEPFDKSFVKMVANIVSILELQPEVFPTARQSVQLEYEKENGDYLEFEIFENQIIMYQEKGGKEKEKTVNKNELNKIIRDFYA